MTAFVWFLIVLVSALAVSGAVALAQIAAPGLGSTVRWRTSLAVLAGAAVGLVGRVHAIADADARVVVKLVHARSSTLNTVVSVVTTVGDLVPSFALAGVLALLLYRRTGQLTAWVLPVVVLVEVAIQSEFLDIMHDPTMARLAVGATIGRSDGMPSGSVSRLFSLSLIAAILWRRHSSKISRGFIEFGSAVVFIALITRLYLARHLLADIVGGLLLGLILTVAFGWVLCLADTRRRERNHIDVRPMPSQLARRHARD
jgi:hypothetical protein